MALSVFLNHHLRRESDSPTLGLGFLHQSADCVKDHLELAVVSTLQRVHLSTEESMATTIVTPVYVRNL